MIERVFRKEFGPDVRLADLFEWHRRPGAFERLVAPWEDVQVSGLPRPLQDGLRMEVTVPLGPLRLGWCSVISDLDPASGFRDVQEGGPFAHWDHHHRMSEGEAGAVLEDAIQYRLPLGWLGRAVAGSMIERRLDRMFAYRHRVTQEDLHLHGKFKERKRMDVLITGASGLLGRSLEALLTTGGHRVRRLVRRKPRGPQEFAWNPGTGEMDPGAVEGADAVIHLAGESIASGRWTRARKGRVLNSRVLGTRHVANAIREARDKPKAFLCASAIGIYGAHSVGILDEEGLQGTDFLAHVCQEWEREALQLAEVRVVRMRFGVVLSAAGGALSQMLLPFRMGVGGRLGDGQQWMSWIALDDAIAAIHHALMSDDLEGAINVVAPNPVTNAEFTRTLGKVLGRPTVLPLPAPIVRLLLGEMGDALLLGSQRVEPRVLKESGFEFRYPDLEAALRHQLGRP